MAVQISGNDITVPRDGSFTRNVTIGGTLTYEDVTNIDSVGLVTARQGIEVGASPGVAASISVDGNAIFSGITTIGGNAKVGSGVTLSPDGNVFTTGITTVGGGLSMGDNVRANFGDGGDLQIYHSGAVDMVESTSTYLILEAPNTIIRNLAGDEAYAKFFGNGSVELYHNGTKQCETSANGLAFPSGKGIDFSAQTATSASGASATSEILDHYEEGTWTPVYESTGGTYGYTTQTGYYTKVGNQVSVSAYIRTSSVSASSHNLIKVTGLPFAEGKGQRTPGSVRSASFQSSGTLEGFPIVWTVEANQSHGELLRFTSSGTTDFTSSTMNNDSHVYLQCTYHAS